MPADPPIERLLTPLEVSEVLHVSRKTLYRWSSSGLFPEADIQVAMPGSRRIRPTLRWREKTVRAWIEGNGNGRNGNTKIATPGKGG